MQAEVTAIPEETTDDVSALALSTAASVPVLMTSVETHTVQCYIPDHDATEVYRCQGKREQKDLRVTQVLEGVVESCRCCEHQHVHIKHVC